MNSELHSESLGNYGNVYAAFSANGFVLPRFARRRREFELRSSSIAYRRSIFANRSSALKSRSSGPACGSSRHDRASSNLECSRSGLVNDSSALKARSSDWINRSSGVKSRSSERHRPPPFSKPAPPIYGMPRLFSNLLFHSSLQLK